MQQTVEQHLKLLGTERVGLETVEVGLVGVVRTHLIPPVPECRDEGSEFSWSERQNLLLRFVVRGPHSSIGRPRW